MFIFITGISYSWIEYTDNSIENIYSKEIRITKNSNPKSALDI